MAEGPDFLCVGMLKGGTRWLFDQLQFHPDFWMPPIKELHYLDRDEGRGVNAKQALKLLKKSRRKTQSADRDYDERDVVFLKEMASQNGPLDVKLYASLFRQKGDKITGDITPHYCTLGKDKIAQITSYLSDVRLVLLVRDPVARAWSQILQTERRGRFSENTLQDPRAFGEMIAGWQKLKSLSPTTETAKKWLGYVPESRFRSIFMDDIIARPDESRFGVLTFLGADPAKPSGELPPDHNPKSGGKGKIEMTAEIQAVLVEHLKDEIKNGAEFFGGHAAEWAKKYGV